jgi:hypothetical protein
VWLRASAELGTITSDGCLGSDRKTTDQWKLTDSPAAAVRSAEEGAKESEMGINAEGRTAFDSVTEAVNHGASVCVSEPDTTRAVHSGPPDTKWTALALAITDFTKLSVWRVPERAPGAVTASPVETASSVDPAKFADFEKLFVTSNTNEKVSDAVSATPFESATPSVSRGDREADRTAVTGARVETASRSEATKTIETANRDEESKFVDCVLAALAARPCEPRHSIVGSNCADRGITTDRIIVAVHLGTTEPPNASDAAAALAPGSTERPMGAEMVNPVETPKLDDFRKSTVR